MESDARSGVIDLRLDPGMGRTGLLVPLRVAALPSGGSFVALALAKAPDQPAGEFERERTTLLAALRALGVRLGGGGPRAGSPNGRDAAGATAAVPAPSRAWFHGLEKAPPMRFQFLF